MADALPLPTERGIEAKEKITATKIEKREEENKEGKEKERKEKQEILPYTTTNQEKINKEEKEERKDYYEHVPFYLRTKETETNTEAARTCTDLPRDGTLFPSTPQGREEEEEEEEEEKEEEEGGEKEEENKLNPFYSHSKKRFQDENQKQEDKFQDHSHSQFQDHSQFQRQTEGENPNQKDRFQDHSQHHRHTDDLMEVALTCGVCLRAFDSEYRRPVLLPECGHTFCRACVKDLSLRHEKMYCPTCRHLYTNPEVDNFPINFSLQILAAGRGRNLGKTKSSDSTECQDHGVRFSFWCRSCEVPVCGECLYEGHQQPSHGVCRIQDVVVEMKARAENLVKDASEEAKMQLAGSLRRVLQGVSDLQEASYILQEAGRINRQVPGSVTLSTITSVFESAKNMKRRVDVLNYGGVGACAGAAGGGAAAGAAAAGGAAGDGAVAGASSSSSSFSPSSSSPVPLYPSLGSLRAGMCGRPVVVALGETGGLAQVKVEEMGIHLYSLRPASTAYSVALKLNVLLSCLNKSSPRVFLDIKAGERALGRIYIKLWGEMRRAEQFVALCLGLFGPSYRDTRFDGVSSKGEPGEYVRGGDYTGKQGLGGEALMDNLEWGGEWTKPMQAGQVCGVGGEEKKKFGALFAICLRDNPSSTFRAPFGMVISGMEVIEVACRHDPFSMVRVADCGVVIDVQGSV